MCHFKQPNALSGRLTQVAEEGDSRAQRNLGVFHSRAIAGVAEKFYDAREANLWFSLTGANPEYSDLPLSAAQPYDWFGSFVRLRNSMTVGSWANYVDLCNSSVSGRKEKPVATGQETISASSLTGYRR